MTRYFPQLFACWAVALSFSTAPIASSAADNSGSDDNAPLKEATTTISLDGLEWASATNGDDLPWPDAVAYCESLELAGHDDWRLPSLAELERLHDPLAPGGESIRSPFVIGGCCLWSNESLLDRPAEDGDEIAGETRMYQWGLMFDGNLPYYAVHLFDDGRALCVRDAAD